MNKIAFSFALLVFLTVSLLNAPLQAKEERTESQKGALSICIRKCNESYEKCVSQKSGLERSACSGAQRACIAGCKERH
ncbi:MAG: hypothetical protein KDK39_06925 [Leptospiraceae bacterium]|nr:hypothetical protein [Leptospiraceae bacterium]